VLIITSNVSADSSLWFDTFLWCRRPSPAQLHTNVASSDMLVFYFHCVICWKPTSFPVSDSLSFQPTYDDVADNTSIKTPTSTIQSTVSLALTNSMPMIANQLVSELSADWVQLTLRSCFSIINLNNHQPPECQRLVQASVSPPMSNSELADGGL